MNDIHTCSYFCDRPACIRAQRDELAARLTQPAASGEVAQPDADTVRLDWLERHCVLAADEYSTGSQLYFGTYATAPLRAAIDSAIKGRNEHRTD